MSELIGEIVLTLWIITVELRLHWIDKTQGIAFEIFEKLLKWAKEKKG